jgi:hypothetical protein
MEEYELDQTLLEGKVGDFGQFELVKVESAEQDELWNYMVRTYHYLGIQNIIGPRIKYLIYLDDRPLGALSYHGGSYKLESRDKYIGWDNEQRLELLGHVVSNNRFLLLPWVRIKYLASHILSRSLRQLQKDWKEKYNIEIYVAETFVDARLFNGTCYRAAGWKHIGESKGYGRQGKKLIYHGKRKHIFLIILDQQIFKMIRPRQPRKTAREEMLEMELATTTLWYPPILKEAGIDKNCISALKVMFVEYLMNFSPCFGTRRPEPFQNFTVYIMGLLSDLHRKSIEPIVLQLTDRTDTTYMHKFLNDGAWDDTRVKEICNHMLSESISEPDGMITTDGCVSRKKEKILLV